MSKKKNTFLVHGISAALTLMIIGILGSCRDVLVPDLSSGGAEARTLIAPQVYMGALAGTWESGDYGEEFVITNSSGSTLGTLTYNWGGFTIYAGNIVQATNVTATTGYIYIQYTTALNTDWEGRYYAVYWSELDTAASPDTVRLSGCSDGQGKEDLQDAIDEYTYENGYFSAYSSFVKTNPPSILPPATLRGTPSGDKPLIVELLEAQAGVTLEAD
jgi:hypothetical protein